MSLPSAPSSTYRVQPSVVVSIFDHYLRRPERSERVIGALLGTEADGVVKINNSFPVPYLINPEIRLDQVHFKKMLELHRPAFPHEKVVGWYVTGVTVDGFVNAVHNENFVRMADNEANVVLTVDTKLEKGLEIAAYNSHATVVGGKQNFVEFRPVDIEVSSENADPSAADLLLRGSSTIPSHLANNLSDLETLLAEVRAYIESVKNGSAAPINDIGRSLLFTTTTINDDDFDKSYRNFVQDLLMVAYLASLTRAHLKLNDRQ
eukprot:TRINITY_DN10397_c0_g1_i1.p1 TRINITY_DN10397_c0_g1~~TRINITY_DN10397_c0_g1_i1.p1  ORF type:complete len:283 (+),score=111.24 TRINITY_DN10397_c0_g1_i1:61-849(+)